MVTIDNPLNNNFISKQATEVSPTLSARQIRVDGRNDNILSEQNFSVENKDRDLIPKFAVEDELSQIYAESSVKQVNAKRKASQKLSLFKQSSENKKDEESYYWESDKEEIQTNNNPPVLKSNESKSKPFKDIDLSVV